jgi:ferredoxin
VPKALGAFDAPDQSESSPSAAPQPGYRLLDHDEKIVSVEDLSAYLADFVRHDPRNHLPEGDDLPIFDEPVVGVAAADDPLFARLPLPEVVGPIHATPDFWLPGAKTVVSFFAPFSQEIKNTYRGNSSKLPTLEWVSARLNGEIFLNVLRRALWRFLTKQGAQAVIPNLDRRYRAENYLAMWSERHVAYVAGVGAFGLHCGLLTAKGAAGRIGSVVADLALPPTRRPYSGVYDYCLLKRGFECGACIKKCPAGALSKDGKDHQACSRNGDELIRPAYRGWGYHSCGHCQNNLPCSDGIPAKLAGTRPLAS